MRSIRELPDWFRTGHVVFHQVYGPCLVQRLSEDAGDAYLWVVLNLAGRPEFERGQRLDENNIGDFSANPFGNEKEADARVVDTPALPAGKE